MHREEQKQDEASRGADTIEPAVAPRVEIDRVEEASEESFPASDAPSWLPLHAGDCAQHT